MLVIVIVPQFSCTVDIVITGSFNDLTVGSAVDIRCEVPGIATDAVSWNNDVYTAQDESSVLMFQSVTSSLNGTMFTCSVNSSLLHNQLGSKDIIVTVQCMFYNI